jgi:hypothetical protein
VGYSLGVGGHALFLMYIKTPPEHCGTSGAESSGGQVLAVLRPSDSEGEVSGAHCLSFFATKGVIGRR